VDEPLNPIGFWSYTSSDDKSAGGRLSQLRRLLADELQLLIGRRQVLIFQDVAAIPHGSDWLKEIHSALDRSSFLIPIVTPAFLESEMCCLEVSRFREREAELGRDDLIFPFVYIDVKDIHEREIHDPAVLALLKSRQWFDFSLLRHRPPDSEEVAAKLGGFAASVRAALRKAVRAPDSPHTPASAEGAPKSPEVAAPVRFDQVVALRSAPPGPPTSIHDVPGPEMVLIPPGRFLMGIPEAESKREGTWKADADARPTHFVTIAAPFWLGKFPVTLGEYSAFAAETGRREEPWTHPGFVQDDRHPVVNVSHEDALAYIAWLNGKTGQAYRLPSEAEWEYAARAGTQTARYWGDEAGKPGEHAHFGVSAGTCAVGQFAPNPFGLFNMLGNVWEWTADHWHDSYKGAPVDGAAWTIGGDSGRRVVRGGSWDFDLRVSRAGYRIGDRMRTNNGGFRLARTHSPL